MIQANLKVYRYDPQTAQEPHYDTYEVKELPDFATVLDALIKVREDIDGTLAMRCSCRSAVCGSCAFRVNGHAKLGCKTKVSTLAPDGEEIRVEPMGNMKVIKDLVTEMEMFWDKLKQVKPWIETEGEPPEREYQVPHAKMVELQQPMNCIMCGACVSDCTVMEVDPSFLGPAALAKAYRFTADPRDGDDEGVSKDRLEQLNAPSGIWDCTRCLECVQACPKGVAPMERIMAMRDQAISAGFHNTNGARHTEAFSESVEQTGTLDELKLVPKSLGLTNIQGLLNYAPVALQALTHGKMPPLMHKKIEGIEHVRRIFEKVDETER
jgi:succinate dehydrogenase / fumarate reductase iron-sulfur subunit